MTLMLLGTFDLYAPNGANYNTLSLIFYTIGMYLYFSNKNSNIAQGFIIFLLFFTKQNTDWSRLYYTCRYFGVCSFAGDV